LSTPGTLEIQGPAGTITITGSIAQNPEPGVPYRMEWNGPFTYMDPNANNQVKPLPAANYPVVVKATRGTAPNQETLASAPYDKLSLVEVNTVKLEGPGGVQLQTNPGPGAGKRIFPEASQPGGTTVPDKVNVAATVFPPIPDAPVRVFFRSYDVDDPSANQAPVDDEVQGSDNCLEARFGPPANCPVAADGLLFDATNDPNAQNAVNGRAGLALDATSGDRAVAGLRVSTWQGANYRVAASTSSTWLDQITVPQSASAGELLHPGEDLVANGRATDMLTVWRTLHLEVDRMDPSTAGATQAGFDKTGSWTRIGRTWRSFPPFAAGRVLEDDAARFIAQQVQGQNVDHSNPNDWRGATVDPNQFGGLDCADTEVPPCYPVSRNSNTKLTVASGNLNDEANPADRRYYLRDDLLSSLTSTTHDPSLIQDIMKAVYVEAREDAPNPNAMVRWLKNVITQDLTAMTFTRDAPNSEAYWSSTVLLAFEGPLNNDYDPTNERSFPGERDTHGPVAGETSPNTDQPVSAVYYESIRDFVKTATGSIRPTVQLDEFYRSNLAHEVLHALTLRHDGDTTGGLMCASLKNDVQQQQRGEITAAQKLQLRRMLKPLVSGDAGTCGVN
jgi:hypothetical protein